MAVLGEKPMAIDTREQPYGRRGSEPFASPGSAAVAPDVNGEPLSDCVLLLRSFSGDVWSALRCRATERGRVR